METKLAVSWGGAMDEPDAYEEYDFARFHDWEYEVYDSDLPFYPAKAKHVILPSSVRYFQIDPSEFHWPEVGFACGYALDVENVPAKLQASGVKVSGMFP